MRKLLYTMLLVFAASVVFAAKANIKDVAAGIDKAAAEAVSAQAAGNSVVDVVFDVKEIFKDFPEENRTYSCVAVRVANNYLLASTACIAPLDESSRDYYIGGGNSERKNHLPLKQDKRIIYATINGVSIPQEKIFMDKESHLILIKAASIAPIPLLFVPDDPQAIAGAFDKLIVNRIKYSIQQDVNKGHVQKKVFLKGFNIDDQTFRVKGDIIRAQSGSPIFGMRDGHEFLIGFNAAETEDFKRTSSNTYYYFTPESLNFLQKHLGGNISNVRDEYSM